MNLIEQIANCIEIGKIDGKSPYPPDMRDKPGADELTSQALEEGFSPSEILNKGMIKAMEKVGNKFTEKKIFIPQMLMSAKAMTKAMQHLKPYFIDGSVKQKGTIVVGTVSGDLHDIGKNLVAMMLEGNGWNVIDLGVDVSSEQFVEKVKENPGCYVGLSALLTTTMVNMEKIVNEVKTADPGTKVLVGGAPVNQDFCDKIGADQYSPDPQGAVKYLDNMVSVN